MMRFFPASELKPRGWLRRQLEIQADGLAGNLDKVWRDVRDSKWIGGDAEGWERVPYWLDGFIPLAYLLDDEDRKARAKKYIDAILAQQREDGWICPCSKEEIPSYDTWAVQLISKVLAVYYRCAGDERIPDVLRRVLKNYHDLLSSGRIVLHDWGKSRWFETFVAIDFLYARKPEPWLRDLGRILKEQGLDYAKVSDTWKRPLNQWTHHTHIVNIGMMLKSEAVSHAVLGEPYSGLADRLYDILATYNATPVATFTGDECLSGLRPIQGTELCAVVELMYSYEWLYAATGDAKWAERLEKCAFNALPGTLSDDMWAHQYDQMSNQISCMKFPGRPVFRTNGAEAHLFGLEPNYGCCTADHGQGWPKCALAAYMRDGDVVENVLPVPSALDADDIRVELSTDYPFKTRFTYRVEARKDVAFRIRIPSFAEDLVVDGEKVGKRPFLTFPFKAGETRTIEIAYAVRPVLRDSPCGMKTAEMGSLVFSVPIPYEKIPHEYERNGVARKHPYCDYEYRGLGDWNYAYCADALAAEEREVGDTPFSSEKPPIVLKAKMRKIDWGLEDGFETVCAAYPESLDPVGGEEEVVLFPYGCAKLRMTQMPRIPLEGIGK